MAWFECRAEYVSADTLVLTASLHWVRAAALQAGDQLIAFDRDARQDGNAFRRWRAARVEAVAEARVSCRKLHLSDGTTVVSDRCRVG
jgi:hypothetical protein